MAILFSGELPFVQFRKGKLRRTFELKHFEFGSLVLEEIKVLKVYSFISYFATSIQGHLCKII